MLLIFLLIPVFIIVYYYYRRTVPELNKTRKYLLLSLRFITIVTLLLLLLNPIISFRRQVNILPEVIFLTDNSFSMDIKTGEESKADIYDTFKNSIENKYRGKNYAINDFTFADGIDGERTISNISTTLQDLSGRVDLGNVKEIFLFSDGWFNDANIDAVNRFNVPVSTIHPAYESDDFDLGINRLIYNQTSYTEEEALIIAEAFADNYEGRGEVSLYINNALTDKKTVDFSTESIKQVSFEHTFNNSGLFTVRTEITAVRQGELDLANNIYPGAIRVLDKRSGVTIITDKLLWDTRFINSALRRDDRKEVEIYVLRNRRLLSGRNHIEMQEAFPDNLQLIILVNTGSLSFDNDLAGQVKRFVGNGGGLLYFGKPMEQLSELIAANDSGINRVFRSTMSFTSEASQYQTFGNINVSGIPPVDYHYVAPMVHPQILARFNNDEQSSAIIYNEYNQGTVLYMPFLNLWRWQLRTEGNHYNTFIHNVVTWLANPAGIDFFAQTDKNSYFLGESVNIKLTALDETLNINPNLTPKLYLRDENENIVKEEYLLFDGREYVMSIPHLSSGKYEFVIEDELTGRNTKGSFVVSEIDIQSRNRGYNYPLLSFISRQTGGNVLTEEDVEQFSAEPATVTVRRHRYEIPLYRHWFIIALLLVSFCTELYLRKKWGLL